MRDRSESVSDNGQIHVIVRTEHFTIPSDWSDHVHTVFNAIDFYLPMKRSRPQPVRGSENRLQRRRRQRNTQRTPGTLVGGGKGIIPGATTPGLINQVYNIASNKGDSRISQGIYANGQYFSPNNLAEFQKYFGLPTDKVFRNVNGFSDDEKCNPASVDDDDYAYDIAS